MVTAQEHVAHGDAQVSRHVVVAHSRFPERRLDVMVGRPAVGRDGRHRHQPLDGSGNLRGAQPVVVAAALLLHHQQVAGEQAGEMAARRRRRDPREVGQLLRGHRAAGEQRGQDAGPGGLAQERRHRGEHVRVAHH